jgi:hypothetical protein
MPKVSDEEFVAEFKEFAEYAIEKKDEINLSPEDKVQAEAFEDSLTTQLADMAAKRLAAEESEATFAQTRAAAQNFKVSRKKFVYSNPNVSDATKAGFGPLKAAATSSSGVYQPFDLSARGFENGENHTKWKRNGNPSYRNFTVEYRIGDTGAWLIAGTTRKTSFIHKNQTAGVKIYYRVYAHSDDAQSAHSNTAVVYA